MFGRRKPRQDGSPPAATTLDPQEPSSSNLVTNYLSFSNRPSTTRPNNNTASSSPSNTSEPTSRSETASSNSRRRNTNNSNTSRPRRDEVEQQDVESDEVSEDDSLEAYHRLENVNFRGFSTSIHDMFADADHERVDCCALTCGGILQSDRDRFLLTGVPPPSPGKRLFLHVLFPVGIFFMAGMGATHIENPFLNQVASVSLMALLLYYIWLQCYKGRTKRLEIRKDLLFTKHQIRNNRRQNLTVLLEQVRPDDDDRSDPPYYLGQSRRDFSCAHPWCFFGLYPEDRPPPPTTRSMLLESTEPSEHGHRNVCGCLVDWLCPAICGMHLQLCGTCALAQEAREIEGHLLPKQYRQIDYVTMQPYMDYYPAIYRNRHMLQSAGDENGDAENAASGSHWPVLSRLSTRILQAWLFLLAILVGWTFLGLLFKKYVLHQQFAHSTFGVGDLIVLLVCFGQTIVVLAILVWVFNRPTKANLSLDALVKFYASGFVLSTSLAVFWELALGTLVRLFVSLILAVLGVDEVVDEDGYQKVMPAFGMTSPWLEIESKVSFMELFGRDHPVLYTFFIAVNTFVLAAGVEEVCKYFGYRMVEHPDFCSQGELEQAAMVVYQDQLDDDEEDAPRPAAPSSRGSPRVSYDRQLQSLQSKAAAITLAMMAVGMGFTCCEDLVYIFVYSRHRDLYYKTEVLVARALFPVHPIAAAMQSIGVIQRHVLFQKEQHKHLRPGLGRILAPAVLFHGSFDFFLLWMDFMVSLTGNGGGDEIPTLAAGGSYLVSFGSLFLAVWYFYSKWQDLQPLLVDMDRARAVRQAQSYT